MVRRSGAQQAPSLVLFWALLILSCCLAHTERGELQAGDEPEKLPANEKPRKFHTVNPEQIAREDRLFAKHAASLKAKYEKLLSGAPDEEEPKEIKLPDDTVGNAKEKAKKEMEAAKTKAKERSAKSLLETKERLKKKAAKAKLLVKEKATKKMQRLTPLTGGPIEKAALAKLDAYKTKLCVAQMARLFASGEATQEMVDAANKTAIEAAKRAEFSEADAIKGRIRQAKIKRALEREAAKADEYLSNATTREELEMKHSENKTATLIKQAVSMHGTKKKPPWRCTEKSCNIKCKTAHCKKWCSRCATLKSEKVVFDPTSDSLVVHEYAVHDITDHPKNVNIVDSAKEAFKHKQEQEKKADKWADGEFEKVMAIVNPPKADQSPKITPSSLPATPNSTGNQTTNSSADGNQTTSSSAGQQGYPRSAQHSKLKAELEVKWEKDNHARIKKHNGQSEQDLGEPASQFTQDAAKASGALSPLQLEKLHDAAQRKAATPGVQQLAGDAIAVSQPTTAAVPVQSPSNNASPHCDHCRLQCKTEKCQNWCQVNHCQAPTKMLTSNCDHCHQTCKTARCKSWCAKNHCRSNSARGETKDDAIERKAKSATHPGYSKEAQAQVQHEVKERLSDLLKESQSSTATMGGQAEHMCNKDLSLYR